MSEGAEKRKNHSVYLALAIGSYLLMCFCWSLGSGIVFILLGVTGFFSFLYWKHKPVEYRPPEPKFQNRQEPRQSTTSFATVFKNLGLKQALGCLFIGGIILIFSIVIFFTTTSDSESVSEGIADVLVEQGVNYYNNNQNDSAIYYYRKALQEAPDNDRALYQMAQSKWTANELDSAYYFFSEAYRLNSTSKEARYGMGQILYAQERYEEALAIATELIAAYPDYSQPQLLAGDSWYIRKEYDQALPYYETAYEAGERSEALCHIMAWIYDNKNQLEKAKPLYKEAFEFNSGNKEVAQRLAELYPGKDGQVYRDALK